MDTYTDREVLQQYCHWVYDNSCAAKHTFSFVFFDSLAREIGRDAVDTNEDWYQLNVCLYKNAEVI